MAHNIFASYMREVKVCPQTFPIEAKGRQRQTRVQFITMLECSKVSDKAPVCCMKPHFLENINYECHYHQLT